MDASKNTQLPTPEDNPAGSSQDFWTAAALTESCPIWFLVLLRRLNLETRRQFSVAFCTPLFKGMLTLSPSVATMSRIWLV